MRVAGVVVSEPYGYTVTSNKSETRADATVLEEVILREHKLARPRQLDQEVLVQQFLQYCAKTP